MAAVRLGWARIPARPRLSKLKPVRMDPTATTVTGDSENLKAESAGAGAPQGRGGLRMTGRTRQVGDLPGSEGGLLVPKEMAADGSAA